MNNRVRKILSVFLCALFLLTPLVGGAEASESFQARLAFETVTPDLAQRGTILKTQDYQGQAYLVLSGPTGEEKVALDYDEDAERYTFEFNAEALGSWQLESLDLGGELYPIDGSFEVIESLEEILPGGAPYVIEKDFDLTMKPGQIANSFGNIVFIDENYNIMTPVLTLDGPVNLEAELYYDGLTVAADESFIDLIDGSYDATISAGGKSVTKTIQVVEDRPIQLSSVSLIGLTQIKRLSGAKRTETGIQVSKETFSKAGSVVITNGVSHNDAIAAISLARAVDGPILFAGRGLDVNVKAEIQRLGAKSAYLIGGTGAVSPKTESDLKALGIKVDRISGKNSMDTAVNTARKLAEIRDVDKIIVVSDRSFADALTAAAYSGKTMAPILYIDGNIDSIRDYIKSQGVNKALIVGGPATVGDRVKDQLEKAGVKTSRVFGANRYATSTAIANSYYSNTSTVTFADGENFPDALTGGVLAGKQDAPVLLTGGRTLDGYAKTFLQGKNIDKAYVFGGPNSISEIVINQIKNELGYEAAKSDLDVDPIITWVDNTKGVIHDLPIRKPSPGHPIRILLDQGHGWRYNQGAVSDYLEGNEMYKFGFMLKKELESYGFYVETVRNDIDAEKAHCEANGLWSTNWFSVRERGEMAEGFDFLLSLHTNAHPAGPHVQGTEVFDSTTTPLRPLASELSSTIAARFGHVNRGVKYRYNNDGPPSANWYGVLRNSRATHSMMLESGFHSNYEDCSKLFDDNFKLALAKDIAKVVADYYGQTK